MSDLRSLEQENAQLKEKIRQYETLINELSAPIIPSIIPNTILIPLMGAMTDSRFSSIQTNILLNIQPQDADTVLVDFTGISLSGLDEHGIRVLSHKIYQLKDSLELMGVEVIFTGFSPEFAQGIIQADIDTSKLTIHSTFRTGLQYLMKKKGLKFINGKQL
ncbi:STAS domain-containing protein [Peribacillus acanthi]|uniref:STAS domain-containing protein n=1 Tax=Peribacillus acanthi TaxID=2171554 RepID=UPI000D3E8E71|nr:STAS domain-containing protein [Peribacillus acanthi]